MTDAARQRRCRERRAAGVIRLALNLPEDDLTAALIEARLLDPMHADDREKIAEATRRFMLTAIVTRDA